jgi:hypothetical protein
MKKQVQQIRIRAAMLKLSERDVVTVDDILQELKRAHQLTDSPKLRRAVECECELMWGFKAHARRIVAGIEPPL